jgi:hypothetical protein
MIELLLTAIPLDSFDQQKLHALVTKIPAAYVKTVEEDKKRTLYYSFPKMDDKGFKINCEAEYFLHATLPTKSKCDLQMLKDADPRTDEQLIEFKDPFVVTQFFNAISFGAETKKWFTSERIYGVALNGKYKEHFRTTIQCSKEKCQMTFSKKPSDN